MLPKATVFDMNTSSWSIQPLLLVLTCSISIAWYICFLWRRRNLYIYSRKVPGPFSLPLIGSTYLFMADPSPSGVLNKLLSIQKSFPGLFRLWLGPHLLYVLTEPEHLEKILTNKNAQKKSFAYNVIAEGIGTGLLTAPVPKWKAHRKIISPSFNQKLLNSYVSVFVKQAKTFCDQLSQYSETKNFIPYPLISRLTFDASCESLMGFTINAQKTNHNLPTVMERLLEMVTIRIFNFWLSSKITFKLSPLKKEWDELLKVCHQVFNTIIDAKKKEYELRKSLTSDEVEGGFDEEIKPFLEKAIEKSYFTDEDLRNEVEILLGAANDTSANTLTFLFEVLGINQDIQQKIYEEVIEVLGEVRDVEPSDLHKLKYTERVIKEVLRYFPPVPFYLRELGEDIDLGEAILPKGASVAICPYYIHRIAHLWPDPLKFDPDRFLSDQVQKRHPCAYLPFSYGPRNCIGMRCRAVRWVVAGHPPPEDAGPSRQEIGILTRHYPRNHNAVDFCRESLHQLICPIIKNYVFKYSGQYGMMNLKTIVATVIRKYVFSSECKSIEDIKTHLTMTLHMEDEPKISVALRRNTKII